MTTTPPDTLDLFAGVAVLAASGGPGGRLPKGWTHKVCPGCQFIYARSDFGTQRRCKPCRAAEYQQNKAQIRDRRRARYRANNEAAKAYSTAWKRRNPDRYADYNRKAKYGLQPGEYAQMLAAQNNRCAICGLPGNKPLHVDHCHASGKVRELLCDLCNRGLGYFQDEPSRLEAAANYLRSHQ